MKKGTKLAELRKFHASIETGNKQLRQSFKLVKDLVAFNDAREIAVMIPQTQDEETSKNPPSQSELNDLFVLCVQRLEKRLDDIEKKVAELEDEKT